MKKMKMNSKIFSCLRPFKPIFKIISKKQVTNAFDDSDFLDRLREFCEKYEE